MTALSREMALRIGLAAKALPDVDPARLMKVLDEAVGLPPSEMALNNLNIKTLKSAAGGELSEIATADMKEALSYLKGQAEEAALDAPQPEAYEDGDMPQSVRVAVASNAGEALDGHFGSCLRFLIYQVSKDEARLIDLRSTSSSEEEDDKNAFRAGLIADCDVLYVVSIGGPAAAKVVRRDVHPIKKPQGGAARDILDEMRGVLGTNPPPFLSKAMGLEEHNWRFESEEAQA